MSERTRQEVWEQIKMSELTGSDVVPLPIETVKLLLECARLVNEGAANKDWATGSRRMAFTEYLLNNNTLRNRCEELSQQL